MSYLEYNVKTVPTGLRKILYVNWPLVLLLTACAAVGFLMLTSVAGGRMEVWAEPQMKRFAVGMAAMLIVAMVPIWFWRNLSALAYGVSLLLLVAVEFFGAIGMGAQRWIDIGPLRLQPSELMKVAIVMLLAAYYDWLDVKKTSRPLWVAIPAVLILLLGTLAARWTISTAGSAGPWESLAESGQRLFEALDGAQIADTTVLAAAGSHQQALSQSLRQSQIFQVVADRKLGLLPLLVILLGLLVGGLSYWAARQLSRGFSRPIKDLVGWTELIGRGEGLPAPGPADQRGVKEFALLRTSLRTMADGLEKGRDEAIQAAKLRSWTEMARRVAHELKNPLAPMRLAATTVSRMDEPGARVAAEVLLEEIDRLDEMARDFSQFGRMPEGPPSEVDLDELLQNLVRQHQGAGAAIDYASPSEPVKLTAHYEALLRCFRNLLLNAVDAAGPSGRVRVGCWREANWAKVEIGDSGPGIPEAHLDAIWEPEFTTKRGGTGLGLPMVRQTIAFHRGKVVARNSAGAGAVFLVELPLEGPIPATGKQNP